LRQGSNLENMESKRSTFTLAATTTNY